MPIGTTNINFSNIQTEFGGTNPISLSEYYRNGSFVANTPSNGTASVDGVTYVVSNSTVAIPTSGVISVDNFKNTANAVVINVTITSDQLTGFNLRNRIASVLGTFAAPIICTCTINSGIIVASNSTSIAAFDTGTTWLAGSTFALVNNGSIIGMGGAGGNGTGATTGTAGAAGGNALNLTLDATITNGSGILSGGGGGGGGGASVVYASTYIGGGGGGGGQSYVSSSGGSNGSWGATLDVYPTAGSSGTNAGGGAGGVAGQLTIAGEGGGSWISGAGGAGAAYGAAGSSGGAVGAGTIYYNATSGGAGGYYLNKNGRTVTWISNGTRNGSEI